MCNLSRDVQYVVDPFMGCQIEWLIEERYDIEERDFGLVLTFTKFSFFLHNLHPHVYIVTSQICVQRMCATEMLT